MDSSSQNSESPNILPDSSGQSSQPEDKELLALPSGPSNVSKLLKRLPFFGLTLAILILAFAGWVVYDHQPKSATSGKSQTSKAASDQAGSKICTIESKTVTDLDCYNNQAQNKVAYVLPNLNNQAVNGLVPSPDGSQYLASNISGSLWLLSSRLAPVRQLKFPAGLSYTPGTASWSHDSKSLFLELDTANGSRQIYQYVLASNQVTQITNNSGINTDPFQTQDGHIIYVYWLGENPQVPYIMNANGSGPRALSSLINPTYPPSIYINSFSGGTISYDAATDTVFLTESNPSSSNASSSDLVYSTIQNLLNGVKPTTLVTDNSVCQLGSTIIRISADQVVCDLPINPDLTVGNIFQLNGDNIQATISPYDVPVEILNSMP